MGCFMVYVWFSCWFGVGNCHPYKYHADHCVWFCCLFLWECYIVCKVPYISHRIWYGDSMVWIHSNFIQFLCPSYGNAMYLVKFHISPIAWYGNVPYNSHIIILFIGRFDMAVVWTVFSVVPYHLICVHVTKFDMKIYWESLFHRHSTLQPTVSGYINWSTPHITL